MARNPLGVIVAVLFAVLTVSIVLQATPQIFTAIQNFTTAVTGLTGIGSFIVSTFLSTMVALIIVLGVIVLLAEAFGIDLGLTSMGKGGKGRGFY